MMRKPRHRLGFVVSNDRTRRGGATRRTSNGDGDGMSGIGVLGRSDEAGSLRLSVQPLTGGPNGHTAATRTPRRRRRERDGRPQPPPTRQRSTGKGSRMTHTVSTEWGGRTLTIETGKVAGQAQGAVTVRYGDSMVLATVGLAGVREGIDFFPLTVDYEERMYAVGKIPGGFIKRESRPSEQAILTARLTDRPIRPLFPKGYQRRGPDHRHGALLRPGERSRPAVDHRRLGGADAVGQRHFRGRSASCRVGYIDGQFVLNPTHRQLEQSALDLVVAGTRDAVLMVEADADELPESMMLEAVRFASEAWQPVLKLQEELRQLAGKPKVAFTPPKADEALHQRAARLAGRSPEGGGQQPRQDAAPGRDGGPEEPRRCCTSPRACRPPRSARARRRAAASTSRWSRRRCATPSSSAASGRTGAARATSARSGARSARCRAPTARPSSRAARRRSSAWRRSARPATSRSSTASAGRTRKRYIHHYNFPPFSTGEVKRLRGASRRDIGHGALAERALVRMSRRPASSPTRSASSPRRCPPTAPPRWAASAAARWR